MYLTSGDANSMCSSTESYSPVFTPSEDKEPLFSTGTPSPEEFFPHSLPPESMLQQSMYHSIPENCEAQESWENLHEVHCDMILICFAFSFIYLGMLLT